MANKNYMIKINSKHPNQVRHIAKTISYRI